VAGEVDQELTRAHQKQNIILAMNTYSRSFAENAKIFSESVLPSVAANIREALSNWDSEVRTAALNVVVVILQNGISGVIDNELLRLCYYQSEAENERLLLKKIQGFVDATPPILTDHVVARRELYLKSMADVLKRLMEGGSPLTREYLLKIETVINIRGPVVDEVYVQKIIELVEAAKSRGISFENQGENIQYFWDLAGKFLRTDLTQKLHRMFPGKLQCANVYVH
jgi:hypothetical protein